MYSYISCVNSPPIDRFIEIWGFIKLHKPHITDSVIPFQASPFNFILLNVTALLFYFWSALKLLSLSACCPENGIALCRVYTNLMYLRLSTSDFIKRELLHTHHSLGQPSH